MPFVDWVVSWEEGTGRTNDHLSQSTAPCTPPPLPKLLQCQEQPGLDRRQAPRVCKTGCQLEGPSPLHTPPPSPCPTPSSQCSAESDFLQLQPRPRNSDTNQDSSVHDALPTPPQPPLVPVPSYLRAATLTAVCRPTAGGSCCWPSRPAGRVEAALARRPLLDLVFSWVASVPFTHTALG